MTTDIAIHVYRTDKMKVHASGHDDSPVLCVGQDASLFLEDDDELKRLGDVITDYLASRAKTEELPCTAATATN